MPLAKPGLFPLGTVVVTSGVLQRTRRRARVGEVVGQLLARHVLGDWGELEATDWAENDYAILEELAHPVRLHGRRCRSRGPGLG